MFIIVEDLITELSQTISLTNRMEVHTIRPYLYKANTPAGDLTLSIKSGSTTIASKTLTIAEIESSISVNEAYTHAFISFEFDSPVFLSKGNYNIVLTGENGYTFTSTEQIGWVKEFEYETNTETSASSVDIDKPMSLQIWSYK